MMLNNIEQGASVKFLVGLMKTVENLYPGFFLSYEFLEIVNKLENHIIDNVNKHASEVSDE